MNHNDTTTDDDERLDQIFAALANRTRRAILDRLAAGPATVKELAEPFAMSLPAVSKHIRVLEGAGLIEQGRDAQYRPCSLQVGPLREIDRWTERYRPIWEDRFSRLDDYLGRLTADDGAPDGHQPKRRTQRSDDE
ncbi:MAG: metalloregulator ArsR/SmtB family transcription factor [Actinomycetota bacterium]